MFSPQENENILRWYYQAAKRKKKANFPLFFIIIQIMLCVNVSCVFMLTIFVTFSLANYFRLASTELSWSLHKPLLFALHSFSVIYFFLFFSPFMYFIQPFELHFCHSKLDFDPLRQFFDESVITAI